MRMFVHSYIFSDFLYISIHIPVTANIFISAYIK